jgi:hypothetical protein
MKSKILTFYFIFICTISHSQISTNDSIIVEYVNDYINEVSKRGKYIRLESVNYILIAPPNEKIKNLARTYKEDGIIVLSNNVRLDRLMLRMTLYRELSYILGVPYDSCLIMQREKPAYFSYAPMVYQDVMNIEMGALIEFL